MSGPASRRRRRDPRQTALAVALAALAISFVLPRPTLAVLSLQVVPNSGRPGDELVATASGSPPGPVSFRWDEMDVLLGIGESNGEDPVSVTRPRRER